jgi:hypothetical protein
MFVHMVSILTMMMIEEMIVSLLCSFTLIQGMKSPLFLGERKKKKENHFLRRVLFDCNSFTMFNF